MTKTAAWLTLFIAGLLEVGWAVGLKFTHGLTRLGPSVATLTCAIGSFVLLAWSLKVLPVGTAYAVWVGIGVIGTALIGIILLGEPTTIARIACIAMITAGLVGLKLVS